MGISYVYYIGSEGVCIEQALLVGRVGPEGSTRCVK